MIILDAEFTAILMKHLLRVLGLAGHCAFAHLAFCFCLFVSVSRGSDPVEVGLLNISQSLLNSGHVVGPRSLDQWLKDAELKHGRLADWEKELADTDHVLRPGTPAYLEWLSRRSSYNSRQLSKFALILEDVALQTVRRTLLPRQRAAPELSLIDISPAAINAQCPVPLKSPCRAARYRTFSGECNNVENPHWGKASTPFSRSLPNAYADGLLVPRLAASGEALPSARIVSKTIHKDTDRPHKHVSHILPFWAQLIEQDISRATVYGGAITESPISCCQTAAIHPECFPIVEALDSSGLSSQNVTCLNYIRSSTTVPQGCRLGERQQLNAVSHWLDGSSIYGANDGFHSFFDDNGLLWMQKDGGRGERGHPPEMSDVSGCYEPSFNRPTCLSTHVSKMRGGGYTPMMALNTILMREHNRIAMAFLKLNPHWDSAIIFQQARRLVIAEIQHITFAEYLPLVLGARSVDKYDLRLVNNDFHKNYSLTVNADVDNAVSTAALKFWHKLTDNRIVHVGKDGSRTSSLLANELYRDFQPGGLDGYLRGALQQPSQQKGPGVAFQLTKNWMKGPDDRLGLDLVALTIQQGRDHGVTGYNDWRQYCGLRRAESFSDLEDTIPEQVLTQLKTIYQSVDDIDLYTGGLSETSQQGALVGPVFACLLGKQFAKLRKADRFWYENDIPPSRLKLDQLNEVRKITLSRLICDNADNITFIQPQAFLQSDQNMNAAVDCVALSQIDLAKWKEDNTNVSATTHPVVNISSLNETADNDPVHNREKRQNFQFPRGNVRQSRQLQPVNQLSGGSGTCGEPTQNCDSTTKFRSVSGFCNNLNRPDIGSIDRVFSRFSTAAYDDDVGELRQASVLGGSLPPVRAVRTSVLTDVDRPHPKFTTLMMAFGQFIDHDMTNTPFSTGNNGAFLSCRDCNSQQTVSAECRPIRVPQGDPVMASFDQFGRPLCLSFTRSLSRRGNDGRRQQVNQLSSYLDGGQIYGTNLCTTRSVRAFADGRLITTRNRNGRGQKDLLMQSTNTNDVENSECRSTGSGNLCFKAGDARANEQPGLSVLHTIWAREHNRISQGLQAINPHWNDQRLFDEARRINVASLQHIIYHEWVPRTVGQPVTNLFGLALQRNGYYKDYDDTCDATISNEFSTAAFRFGHSLIPMVYGRYDHNFNPLKGITLFEHFSRSDVLYDDLGVDKILIGMTLEPMQNADFSFSRAVSDRLFQDPNKALGTDLIAINIMRGRDHGLAPYNVYRERCNMTKAKSFDDLLGDIPKFLVDKLAQLYRHVDDIDLYAGGTSELPVVGGLVGPTFACIIAEQFLRLRKCDRFWYETDNPNLKFTNAQIAAIRKVTMAKLVCANSDTIKKIQRQAFELPDTFQNAHTDCDDIPDLDLSPWQEVTGCAISGITMQVGDTDIRVSPCIICSCTVNGPDCRSLNIKSCSDLAQDFTREQILSDDVCKVQCAKDFSDSTQDDQ